MMENFDVSSLELSGFNMSGAIIDIIIAVVIIFSAIYGYFRGFIRSALGIITFAVSFVCAFVFTPFVYPIIYDGFMLKIVSGAARKALELAGIGSVDVGAAAAEMSPALSDILSRFGINISAVGNSGIVTASEMADGIAGPAASVLSKAAAYLGIFFITALLLHIIGILIEKAMKLTGMSGVNRFFGGVLGVVCGVFYALVITAVLRGAWPSLCAAWPDIFPRDALGGSLLISLGEKISFGLIAERILRFTES